MFQSDNINELATALSKAQGEFKSVDKKKTASVKMKNGGTFSYKYADIADVFAAIIPILSKHGLSLVQSTDFESGMIVLITKLLHSSGQWIGSRYPVCLFAGVEPQKVGASLTYARRYAISSLVGVVTDDDTDGEGSETASENAHGDKPTIEARREPPREIEEDCSTPAQIGVRAALIRGIGLCRTIEDLTEWYKCENTATAMDDLDNHSRDSVRRAWGEKRKELSKNQ